MSAEKNSLFAAAVVVSGALAATLGMVVRDRVDLPFRQNVVAGELPGTRMVSAQDPKEAIDIPEREYFEQMVEMLKQGYVEPVGNDQKLVSGAVRGMVGSLEDPNALFFDKDEFIVFQNAREGQYAGIGVDLVYVIPPKSNDPNETARMPRLIVGGVVPGGPAATVGIKAGDIIDTIDGRWVINLELFEKFRQVAKAVEEKKAEPSELSKLRNELRQKTEHGLLPVKARNRLVMGTSGQMKLKVQRGSEFKEFTVEQRPSVAEPVTKSGDALAVRIMPGVGPALKQALPKEGTVTLDLRNNTFADIATVSEALAVLGPKGSYGQLVNERGGKSPLAIAAGRDTALKYRLIVDSSTQSGAALLVSALKGKGLATVEGTPSKNAIAVEVVKLPDGSGFTLPRGTLKTEVSK